MKTAKRLAKQTRCPIWVLITLNAWLISGCSQRSVQLLHSANEMPNPVGANWVRDVWEKPRLHQVMVVDQAGHKQAVAASSIWGYRTNHNELYRLYRDTFYEVLQRGPLSVYQLDEWVGDSRWTSYYFSLTPNGDIYDLDRRTIKSVFRDDECMQRLVSQMRERHLLRTDSRGSYGLASAYSFCHCRNTVNR